MSAVPYQARRSGASIDRAQQVRALEVIQKRGRWSSQKSVKRYEKSGRLNEVWKRLSPAVQAHCELCALRLEDYVLNGATLPRPALVPLTPGRRRKRAQ